MGFFDSIRRKPEPEERPISMDEYRGSREYPMEKDALLERMNDIKKDKQRSDTSKMDKVWMDKYPGEIPPKYRRKKMIKKSKPKRKPVKRCKCK